MPQLKKVRLSESIIDAIKDMIRDQGLGPGDKFLSEKALTTELEVSRSSVREALRILEITGQVEVRQGKGIFITHSVNQEVEAFAAWLRSNEQSILDHFEARLTLEPVTAWKAAQLAENEDIVALSDILREFNEYAAKGDTVATIECDREFHRQLARTTKNKTLYFLLKFMTTSLPEGWITSLYTPGRIKKTKNEHQDILDAIERRDPDAAKAMMTAHLEKAMADIKALQC